MRSMKRLTDKEANMLREVIERRESSLTSILDHLEHHRLTPPDREALREVLADELAEYGLDADWEPNQYGLNLDALIGRLGEL